MANYAKDLTKITEKNIKNSLKEMEELEKMQQEYLELESASQDQLNMLYYTYDNQIHNIMDKQTARLNRINQSYNTEHDAESAVGILVSTLCVAAGTAALVLTGTLAAALFTIVSAGFFAWNVEFLFQPIKITKHRVMKHFEDKKVMKLKVQMKDVSRVMDNTSDKKYSEIMEEKINERAKTMPEKYEFKKPLTQELDLRPDLSKDFLENEKIM